MGISFGMRDHIAQDEDRSTTNPNKVYSAKYGFNPEQYNANGLIFNFQYNTRENPNRSFGGIYAGLYFRSNFTWLGSSRSAGQMYTEFRKYWSLSKKNPENVIAVWYWGSYLLWGTLPYLELQNTANDTYNRSGRGYTMGRFRGQNYAYLETEYRFPISQTTKLFSGVVFTNLQTESEAGSTKMFRYLEPAVGAGIRLLFNKGSRTNICLDYAHGLYGSKGFFFTLNEAF
jgi:Omp85 superfamily domain